ncbi:MAG: hypothetical protein H6740_28850 [Alphaproteobacteria bacterium]|nr:hypothetical protein [Alphaproteobacteria bacterium]
MKLPVEVRENLVMTLDEWFETENDDPDAEELASVFVKFLERAAEEAEVEDAEELVLNIEEEAELDDSLYDVLGYEFGKHDDLELSGEEVVTFVEKLGFLDWEVDEDMMDDIDDLDLDDPEGYLGEEEDS